MEHRVKLLKKRIYQNEINFLLMHGKIKQTDISKQEFKHDFFKNNARYTHDIKELNNFYQDG